MPHNHEFGASTTRHTTTSGLVHWENAIPPELCTEILAALEAYVLPFLTTACFPGFARSQMLWYHRGVVSN